MTIQIRRVLFYSLLIVFIAVSASTIFYSNGWRFDLETLTINKLGAIYFKKVPADATIVIEKTNLTFKPGILGSGLLVANLFPKVYPVKISKAGYQKWNKELSVKPSLVTEVPPIILLPEKIELGAPLAKNASDFWAKGKQFIALSQSGGLFFNAKKIIGEQVVTWAESNRAVITRTGNNFFLINLRNISGATNLELLIKNFLPRKSAEKIQQIKFAGGDTTFLIQTASDFYLFDLNQLAIAPIATNTVEAFSGRDKEVIFVNKTGVFSYDLGFKTKNLITDRQSPVFSSSIKDVEISPAGDWVSLLNTTGNLILLDKKFGAVTAVADNALRSAFSPDGKKLAFTTTNKEVVIYEFTDKELTGKKKTVVLNVGLPAESEISWHNASEYLFLKYPNDLYLLEANNLPPINLQLIDSKIEKYQYNGSENSLYLLKNGSLYKWVLE